MDLPGPSAAGTDCANATGDNNNMHMNRLFLINCRNLLRFDANQLRNRRLFRQQLGNHKKRSPDISVRLMTLPIRSKHPGKCWVRVLISRLSLLFSLCSAPTAAADPIIGVGLFSRPDNNLRSLSRGSALRRLRFPSQPLCGPGSASLRLFRLMSVTQGLARPQWTYTLTKARPG